MKIFSILDEINSKTLKDFIEFYEDTINHNILYPMVFINSTGGDVSAANTICSIIENSDKEWITYTGGQAMSSALNILVHGNHRFANNKSVMMYHNMTVQHNAGNYKSLQTENKVFQKYWIKPYNTSFANQTNEDIKYWDRQIDSNTGNFYFNAKEALKLGAIDYIGFPSIKTMVRIEAN